MYWFYFFVVLLKYFYIFDVKYYTLLNLYLLQPIMTEEQEKEFKNNQEEIINRLALLQKALNQIIPTPLYYKRKLPKDLMNYKDAAKYLGIGETTICNMSRKNKLPLYNLPKGRKFSRKELDDYIKDGYKHKDRTS